MTFALIAVARRTAALGLCAVAILAAPSPAAAAAGAELDIAVSPADGGAYRMNLRCGPDGGGHPRPVEACDALRAVNGWIKHLNVDPGPCPLIYMPVDVSITGHWRGRRVSYQHRFPSTCEMRRALGPVVEATARPEAAAPFKPAVPRGSGGRSHR
ncbi:SSI family serine proteinase inhibitor [Nonomuraea sp. SYSU D8015]|uniref:SSI family serine proteinase inhibitor n=1 Tax=Nonomuraea sp. SYSU D8015 TaxID=2593644 RepID=UPI001660D75B|nr:SSI family serine proteinase inhibitor [Nonomuraea sp. SYSU D8015]